MVRGIGIVEIDSVTGLAVSSVTHLYGRGHQSIEAPYLFKEGGYYYLVVNRGNCCQEVNSTYYITVGLSASVTGPYEGWLPCSRPTGGILAPVISACCERKMQTTFQFIITMAMQMATQSSISLK
ncbi:MAG: family 43 glycosylhydrolase [Bacteroidales bacterium]|nr:family 43 glycosylhydrolase [Bacteroidales bacterium]